MNNSQVTKLIFAALVIFSRPSSVQSQNQNQPDQFPYLAAILHKKTGQFVCAATIIDKHWVLSSGSPVAGQLNADELMILAGVDNFNDYVNLGQKGQLIEVSEYHYTDNYKVKFAIGNSAIFKLAQPLKWNNKVLPLNMLDIGYSQSRLLTHYKYDDDAVSAFLSATTPQDKLIAGWDIYGYKTAIDVESNYVDEDWFKDWSRGLFWGYSETSHRSASDMMESAINDKPAPIPVPFFRPIAEEDNILTWGFTGGPLLCDGYLCGIATWWTQSVNEDGTLSSELQGNPEATDAISRWIDYSPVLDPFVMAITAEDLSGDAFSSTGMYAGIGNVPPTTFLPPDAGLPAEALTANEPLPDFSVEAGQIISWHTSVNTRYRYFATDNVILKPGFHAETSSSGITTLEATDLGPVFHAAIKPHRGIIDAVGVTMGAKNPDFASAIGFLVLQMIWPETAYFSYNGLSDLFLNPSLIAQAQDFPPIISLTGDGMDTGNTLSRDYNKEDSDRPRKRQRTSGDSGDGGDGGDTGSGGGAGGGAGGGGSGDGGGSGGNDGGDDKDDDDDKDEDEDEEPELELEPIDQTLTYRFLQLIIDWNHVDRNGGLAVGIKTEDLMERVELCTLIRIFKLLINQRNNSRPFLRNIDDPARTAFIDALINRVQTIIDKLKAAEEDIAANPLDNLDANETRMLDYAYGFNPAMDQVQMRQFMDRITNPRPIGYNTNRARGLHARVIEQHINWDGEDPYRGITNDGHFFGVDELIQNLIINADYLDTEGGVFGDPNAEPPNDPNMSASSTYNPIEAEKSRRLQLIRQLYAHIRKKNANQHEIQQDLLRYYRWRPNASDDKNPPLSCEDDGTGNTQTCGEYNPSHSLFENQSTLILCYLNEYLITSIYEQDNSGDNWLKKITDIFKKLINNVTKNGSGSVSNLDIFEEFNKLKDQDDVYNSEWRDEDFKQSLIALGIILSANPNSNIESTYRIKPDSEVSFTYLEAFLVWLKEYYIPRLKVYYANLPADTPNDKIDRNFELNLKNRKLITLLIEKDSDSSDNSVVDELHQINNHFIQTFRELFIETAYVGIQQLEPIFEEHKNAFLTCLALGRDPFENLDPLARIYYQGLIRYDGTHCRPIDMSETLKNESNRQFLEMIIIYFRENYDAGMFEPVDPMFFQWTVDNWEIDDLENGFDLTDIANRRSLYLDDEGKYEFENRTCDVSSYLINASCIDSRFVYYDFRNGGTYGGQPRTLDMDLFLERFDEITKDMVRYFSTATDAPSPQSIHEYLKTGIFLNKFDRYDVLRFLSIIISIRNENLDDRSNPPLYHDPKRRQKNDAEYDMVVDLISIMFSDYVLQYKQQIQKDFVVTNKGYDGWLIGDDGRYYVEMRGMIFKLLEYYVNWSSYLEKRRNGESIISSLGCRIHPLRTLIVGDGSQCIFIMEIEPGKMQDDSRFVELIKIIEAIRSENITSNSRPPGWFWLQDFSGPGFKDGYGYPPEHYLPFGDECDTMDDDNDGALNVDEDLNQDGNLMNDNTDGDGYPNFLDWDDDGDGILTINEDANSNGDPTDDDDNGNGIPNYLDTDDLVEYGNVQDPFSRTDQDEVSFDADNTTVVDSLDYTILYPNPTQGNISLSGLSKKLDNYKVVISNTSGQIISEFSFKDFSKRSNEIKMELIDLQDGLYIMTIISGDNFVKNLKFRLAR